jgi:hypothetical protein
MASRPSKAKGTAVHGISEKYSWKLSSSWSEVTNTTSTSLGAPPAAPSS